MKLCKFKNIRIIKSQTFYDVCRNKTHCFLRRYTNSSNFSEYYAFFDYGKIGLRVCELDMSFKQKVTVFHSLFKRIEKI